MRSVLASWFRLKYPHVALGALASSAPILYFNNITPSGAYYSIVSKDFRVLITFNQSIKRTFILIFFPSPFIYLICSPFIPLWYMIGFHVQEASETCYQTIRKSWSEIDKIASKHHGLSTLSKKFKTCEYEPRMNCEFVIINNN